MDADRERMQTIDQFQYYLCLALIVCKSHIQMLLAVCRKPSLTGSAHRSVSALSAALRLRLNMRILCERSGCLIQHGDEDVCLTQNEIARYVEIIFEESGHRSLCVQSRSS